LPAHTRHGGSAGFALPVKARFGHVILGVRPLVVTKIIQLILQQLNQKRNSEHGGVAMKWMSPEAWLALKQGKECPMCADIHLAENPHIAILNEFQSFFSPSFPTKAALSSTGN
jgi:sarcosine oxidase gamma subunit